MKERNILVQTALAAATLLWGVHLAQAGAAGPITTGPVIPNYDLPNYAYSPLPTVTGISGITVLNGGVGYSAPTVTLTVNGIVVDTATATVPVISGPITTITPTTPRMAYTSIPTVTITDATGLGASAVAIPVVTTGTGLRKFVDSVSGIPGVGGVAGTNGVGQCLPLAVAMDANTPVGVPQDGDYYEIAVVEYQEKMHSDLPGPTRLRGYVQIEPPGAPQPPGSAHVALTYPNGTPITS